MRRFFIFVSLFHLSLPSLASTKTVNPKELERIAEVEGSGYKSANLILLNRLLSDPELQKQIAPLIAGVPEFLNVKSSEVQDLLKLTKLDLSKEWSTILSRSLEGNLSSEVGKALSEKTLPPTFLDACKQLSDKIKRAFFQLASKPVLLMKDPKKFQTLTRFSLKADVSSWKLAVRSTGKEDTDKLANAGGNRSELNVNPDLPSLLFKMGSVVSSYFEHQSLTQRTLAGDYSIFDLPITPVLIQRMVGEDLDGARDPKQIPSGCVVYTVEPAAYSPGSKNQADVNTLQCSFGSNAGVVQSLVPLDTFYVEKNGNIKSILKSKTKRLVPSSIDISGLRDHANPKDIHSKPSLDKNTVLAVSKISTVIAQFYKKPMDIELVYMPQEKKIYIVQARPLVFKAKAENPSYIRNLEAVSKLKSVEFSSIVPVDSAVKLIVDKKQILLGTTLNEALLAYQKSDKLAKKQLVAVFAEKEVDTTSHEAAVFRGDGKIILQSKNLHKLKEWIEDNSGMRILLDIQRGLAVNVKASKFEEMSIRQLKLHNLIDEGWVKYPIPLALSIDAFDEQIRCTALSSVNPFYVKAKCKADFYEDALEDFAENLVQIRELSACKGSDGRCRDFKLLAESELDRANKLQGALEKLHSEVRENESSQQLQSLFSKRFLEAAIEQEGSEEKVGAYSIKSLTKDFEDKRWILHTKILPLVHASTISDFVLKDKLAFELAMLGLSQSVNSDMDKKWLRFIDHFFIRKGELPSLLNFVNRLRDLKIFDIWLNTEKEANHLSWEHFIASKAMLKDSDAYLSELDGKLQSLRNFALSSWENEKDFTSIKTKYDQQFTDYFTSDKFLKTSNDLEMFAKLSAMEEFLFLYDMTGKTLRSYYSQYENKEQLVANFKKITIVYLRILSSWVKLTPDIGSRSRNHNAAQIIESVKSAFEKVRKEPNSEDQINPSEGFSVLNAALSEEYKWGFEDPVTTEDFFTYSHQSCNGIVSRLYKSHIAQFQKLPTTFERISTNIKNFWKTVNLSSTRVEKDFIVSTFHMPLGRAHEARVELTYLRKQNSHQITVTYQGGYISHKKEELKIAALLWSFYHGSFEREESYYTLKFRFENVEKIHDDALKDLIQSCNNVTFTHHTELKEDFLKTVPIASKVMKILNASQMNKVVLDESDFNEVLPLITKSLKSPHFDDNNLAVALIAIFATKNEKLISQDFLQDFYPKILNFLDDYIRKVESPYALVQKFLGILIKRGIHDLKVFNTYKNCILKEKRYSEEDLVALMLDRGIFLPELVELFKSHVNRMYSYTLIHFVKKGLLYKEAIEKAGEDMKSIIVHTSLFEALFEKDQGFEEAIEGVLYIARRGYLYSGSSSFPLMTQLFAKGRGFEEVNRYLEDKPLSSNSLEIYLELAKNRKHLESAKNATLEAFRSGLSYAAKSLLSIFIEQNYGVDEFLNLATEKPYTHGKLDLLSSLAISKIGIDRVAEVLSEISFEDHDFRTLSKMELAAESVSDQVDIYDKLFALYVHILNKYPHEEGHTIAQFLSRMSPNIAFRERIKKAVVDNMSHREWWPLFYLLNRYHYYRDFPLFLDLGRRHPNFEAGDIRNWLEAADHIRGFLPVEDTLKVIEGLRDYATEKGFPFRDIYGLFKVECKIRQSAGLDYSTLPHCQHFW